jgi:small subunit ribosomal protein S5
MYNDSSFEERVVQIKRVSKKTKGGNNIGFTALVVVGDRSGKVGAGLGKAKDVPSAIRKGVSKAKRNIVTVKIEENTIPHEVTNKFKAATVLLKPASKGSGIIAGGAVRDVLELCGIKDISAKIISGTTNKMNIVNCTLEALQTLRG